MAVLHILISVKRGTIEHKNSDKKKQEEKEFKCVRKTVKTRQVKAGGGLVVTLLLLNLNFNYLF